MKHLTRALYAVTIAVLLAAFGYVISYQGRMQICAETVKRWEPKLEAENVYDYCSGRE